MSCFGTSQMVHAGCIGKGRLHFPKQSQLGVDGRTGGGIHCCKMPPNHSRFQTPLSMPPACVTKKDEKLQYAKREASSIEPNSSPVERRQNTSNRACYLSHKTKINNEKKNPQVAAILNYVERYSSDEYHHQHQRRMCRNSHRS